MNMRVRNWRFLIALLLFHICYQISARRRIQLSRLKFDIIISRGRLSDGRIAATFHNVARKESSTTLKLFIPENALVSSVTMNINGKIITSTIQKAIKRKKTSTKTTSSKGENSVRLQHRPGRAQVLRVKTRMPPGENITLFIKYSEILRRSQGRYYEILYLPHLDASDLAINIRVLGKIEDISFLKADGEENPLSVIKHGIAEVYAATEQESKLNYRRNKHSPMVFSALNHYNPSLSNTHNSKIQFSLNPSKIPSLLLVDRGFVLSYDTQRYPAGGLLLIQNNFFVNFFSPEELPKLPIHTVFVLDKSGSMDGSNKISNLKSAMKIILRSLKPDDSFEIIVFSSNAESYGVFTALSSDISRSISKIDSLEASGGTNIDEALMKAINEANKYPQPVGVKQIIFLTDGKGTDTAVIRQNVIRANIDQLPIYTIAFGDDADIKFLRQISLENFGFVKKIRSEGRPAEQMKSFYKDISTPLLTDVTMTYNDNVVTDSVFRLGQASFYSGNEIITVGELKNPTEELNIKILAKSHEGTVQLTPSQKVLLAILAITEGEKDPKHKTKRKVHKGHDSFHTKRATSNILTKNLSNETLPIPSEKKIGMVEHLWAHLVVQDLLSSLEVVEDKNERRKLRAKARKIALKYKFVTKLTSLVMVDTSKQSAVGGDIITGRTHGSSKKLPNDSKSSVTPPQSNRFSFVDNDPHFVVQVSGLALPFCFDLHGQPGNVFSLVRDKVSGLIVNAKVSAAIGRPGATYFTEVFVSLEKINLTITTSSITIECIHGNKRNEVLEVWHESYPFESQKRKRARRRKTLMKHKKRKNRQINRKIRSTIYSTRNDYQRRKLFSCPKCIHNKYRYVPSKNKLPPIIDIYYQKSVSNAFLDLSDRNAFNENQLRQLYNRSSMKQYRPTSRHLHTLNRKTKSNLSQNECHKILKWQYAAKRRYDNVELTIRGRQHKKRLDVIVGDVDLHIVITNTRKKNKQSFLGFYIQEQKILSSSTNGVIGEFVSKSVRTVSNYSMLSAIPESKIIDLEVINSPPTAGSQPKINKITATVSKRRSLLRKERVVCLHVKRHGKGLLARRSKKYLLPNLDS